MRKALDLVLRNEVRQAERRTSSHLMMLEIHIIFGILLAVFTVVMGWELWTIPVSAACSVAACAVHVGQIGSERFRQYLYIGLLMVEVFYFGIHPEVFFCLPMVFGLLFLELSMLGQMDLVYFSAGIYLLVPLYHLAAGNLSGGPAAPWGAAGVALGVGAMAALVLLARFAIARRIEEQEGYYEALDALEKENHLSEDFLANVSHGLRTPINMVTGLSELVLQGEVPASIYPDIRSIQRAGVRLAEQINDLLDYTDLAAGKLSVSREDYLSAFCVKDMAAMAAGQNADGRLELVFDVDPAIPAVLIGDEAKVRRVVKILLDNAIKFTQEGGVYVRLWARRENYGINLSVDIQDTGIGMTEEQMGRIYQGFYQVDSGRNRRKEGLGLGLAIAHGLVHAMGGFMNIVSQPGKGTLVHASFPQGVGDGGPCVTVPEPEGKHAAFVFQRDAYAGELHEFYKRMLDHFGEHFGVDVHRVFSVKELKVLQNACGLTHVFLSPAEYEEDPEFYEGLSGESYVCVLAQDAYSLPQGSGLHLLGKPVSTLSIADALREREEPAPVGSPEAMYFAGVRALVVDDEPMNLTVAKGVLSNYGLEVSTCSSGPAALEKCAQESFDVVFMDHMMPEMDGVETLKQLRELPGFAAGETPVAALTANAINGAREMFKREGFDEFVAKPIERSALERALRRLLGDKAAPAGAPRPAKPAAGPSTPAPETAKPVPAPAAPAAQPAAEPQDGGAGLSPVERLRGRGFNVEGGIGYCGGEEDFYLEILQGFYEELVEKQEEIARFYAAQDWKNYTIRVHAMKSSARTIGADALSDCALKLEQAGKAEDGAYIHENQPELERLCAICRGDVEYALGIASAPQAQEKPDGGGQGETLSPQAWLEAVAELRAAMATYESERAVAVIDGIAGQMWHGQLCGEALSKVRALAEDFDFEAAGEALDRLVGKEEAQ